MVTTSAGGSGGCAGGGGGGSGRDKMSREKNGGFSSSPTPMRSSRTLANEPPKNYKELSVSFGDNNGSFSEVVDATRAREASLNILQRYAQTEVRTPQGHIRTWIARRAEMGHFEQNDGPNLGTDHMHNELGTIVHTQTLQDGRASGSCNQGALGYATLQHQKQPVAEYLNAASLDGESTADHISNEGVMKDALDPQVEETTGLKSVWADFHRDLGAVNAVFGSVSTKANGNAFQVAGNVTSISHHVGNDGGGRGGAQNRNGSATISHQHTSTSLRITEMIELMDDGSSEIDSGRSEPPLITVNGYRVKPENAGFLRSILAKHGDIGAKCLLGSVRFRSFFMDCVCQFLQKLMTTSVFGIRQHEIQDMQASLAVQDGKVDVLNESVAEGLDEQDEVRGDDYTEFRDEACEQT
ncbi:hypothetical protein Cgig2_019635 [Carnegiea gigantea]|uniref:Uncharacterized protein n=1 Tax=Carnegiea gigantea TaxID=171969 RepID=A0A9Q1QIC4_9CARY|nr:hypothetical protein Cgig2_019635 [Carnegiea gigantea]